MTDEDAAVADRRGWIARRLRRKREFMIAEFSKAMVTGQARECPICSYIGEFAPVGSPPRLDGLCPSCASRERHRLFKLWLDRETPIRPGHRVLHFAPEPVFVAHLRGLAGTYVTANIRKANVDLALDITDIRLPEASFDIIIAHQILEHVDHRKALDECFRCLAPGGVFVVTTPIIEAWPTTYENPAITGSHERFLHFGQQDHSRIFGRDLKDHMRAAGFELTEFVAVEPDVFRYALVRGETLFILRKPTSRAIAAPSPDQPVIRKPRATVGAKSKSDA